MKNKRNYYIIAIFTIAILSLFVPVKTGKGRWINDSDIYDVGHYLTSYYNIYGIKILEK